MARSYLRLLAVPVFAGVAVLGTAGAAQASDLTDLAATNSTIAGTAAETGKYSEAGVQSLLVAQAEVPAAEVQAATTAAVLKACNGSEALTEAKYFVDGKQVDWLMGNVPAGSTVRVDFTLAKNCEDTKIGLAAYKAPSDTFTDATVDKQVLAASDTKIVKAGESASVEVKVNDCFFQVDFFTGEVLDKLTATNRYSVPVDRLISWDNGGTTECVTPPPPVVPPVTPPPVTPPPVEPPVTPPVTPPVEPPVTPPVAPPVTPPEVLNEVVTPPAPEVLAYTGVNTVDLLMLGSALSLMGVALTRAGHRARRNVVA